MNQRITAAAPPLFSETHAATIAAAAQDYPDADGMLIDMHAEHMLVAVPLVNGIVVRWVVESAVGINEMSERQAQLKQAGLQYVCLTMHTGTLLSWHPKTSH